MVSLLRYFLNEWNSNQLSGLSCVLCRAAEQVVVYISGTCMDTSPEYSTLGQRQQDYSPSPVTAALGKIGTNNTLCIHALPTELLRMYKYIVTQGYASMSKYSTSIEGTFESQTCTSS